jgi:hypothetical protein
MSELELMDMARQYDGLVESAQSALRAEFQQRGLEPPLIEEEEEEQERTPSKPNLVTVGRYRDLSEAIVARAVLQEAGIACFLRDENTVRLDWGLSNVIGGMRLEVGASDAEDAVALLSQPMPSTFAVDSGPDFIQPVCPVCGSVDVMANDTDRKIKAASTLAGGLSLMVGLPALAFVQENVWKCNTCGCRWADDEEPASEDEPLR